jgi:hypothetical protein
MDESQAIASGNDLLTALCKALDLKPEFVCRMVLDVTVTDIPMVYVETTVPSTKVEVIAECVRGVEVRVIGGDRARQNEEAVTITMAEPVRAASQVDLDRFVQQIADTAASGQAHTPDGPITGGI